jgi:hypothetical protein
MRQPFAALILMLAASSTPLAADLVLTPEQRQPPLMLTIYADGWALVWDRRNAELAAGTNRLVFEGVSQQVQPSTAMIEAGTGVRVVDIDYDFALLTPEALLRRSVGKTIGVVRTHPTTGEETVESATLLSAANGIVLKYQDRIETGAPGRLVFYDVPADLRARPSLLATVEAEGAGRADITLGYIAQGLGWTADYVALWDADAKVVDLTGRATLSNTSGTSYPSAEVSLVAGTVNRETPMLPVPRGRVGAAPMMAEAKSMPVREELVDLYVYRLPGQVTLLDQRSRQVTLLHAPSLPVEQLYVSESGLVPDRQAGEPRPRHPQVRLKLLNKEAAGGQPLPAGIVRVFAAATGGFPRLIGEDRIDHTPVGGPVTLTPGDAFDVTVLRRQTDYRTAGLPENVSESAWSIVVENAKDEQITIDLVENVPGDWTVLAESAPHAKVAADRLAWRIGVPAKGKNQLTFRMRVQS